MRIQHHRFISRGLVMGLALLAAPLAGTTAHAQAPETPAVRADRLFREAKTALDANRFAEACPKLAESQRLDPGTGTLLALALCHEGNGQTASALRDFQAVRSASQGTRPDRVDFATQHIKGLEPNLATLALKLPSGAPADVVIRIDGEEVLAATRANPIPLDPGDHVAEARVQDTVRWTSRIHLGAREAAQLTLPNLDATASANAIAPAEAPQPMGTRHLAGWIAGGTGVAALGLGSVFGILALSKQSDATTACPMSPQCSNPNAISENSSARTDAWVADVGIGLGLAALGAAAYLLLTHDDVPAGARSSSGASLVPSLGPGAAGLTVAGRW